MPVNVTWNQVTRDTNNNPVTGDVGYRFDDNVGAERDANTRNVLVTDAELAAAGLTYQDPPGRMYTCEVRAVLDGFNDSALATGSVLLNRPPVPSVDSLGINVHGGDDDSPATASATASLTVADESLAALMGAISGDDLTWAITFATEDDGMGNQVRTGGVSIVALQPGSGWGAVGTTYTATITFTDAHGATATVAVTVTVVNPPNTPPQIPADQVFEVTQGTSYMEDLTPGKVNDPDGTLASINVSTGPGAGSNMVTLQAGITVSLDEESGETLTDQMTIAVPQDAPVGDYTFTVIATDDDGAVTRSSGWLVRVVAPTRTLATPGGLSVVYT